MKRLSIVFLALLLIFTMVGCKTKDDKNTSSNQPTDRYNLSEYMKSGRIPEADYSIGTAIDVVLSHNDGQADDKEADTDAEIYEITGNRSTYVPVEDYLYYFENGKREEGVSSIVSQGKAFGFEVGAFTSKSDVIEAFPSYKYTERSLNNNQIYFVPFELEGSIAVTYEIENWRLDFIFYEGSLFAVNLVNADKWTF